MRASFLLSSFLLLCAFAICLACGAQSLPFPGPGITAASITKVNAYGDSITIGDGLPSPSTQNWAVGFAAGAGLTLLNNYAVVGDRMNDAGEIAAAYSNSPATDTASIIIPGANDSGDYPTPSHRPILVDGYRAFAAWLALPTGQKVTATSGITFSGSWSAYTEFGLAGKYTVTVNDTAAATLSGSAVYIAGWVSAGNDSIIEVRVDGLLKGTFTMTNPLSSDTFGGSLPASTAYPYCYRVAGLTAGSHTVQVKFASTDDAGAMAVQWMGSNGTLAGAGPLVGIGATLPYNDSNTSGYITALNVVSAAMVAELASDGLRVRYIDDNTILALGATDFQQTGTPNLHPTVLGASKIATRWAATWSP